MWKCISRGLRESFERRINFTRKDKAAGQDGTIGLQNKFIPCLLSSHVFDKGSGDLGGRCKNGPCNDKKQQNREHQGQKWKENYHIEQSTIFGALGWSGVMVLGWYFCQPICRHRHKKPPELDRFKNRANISRCHTHYISLLGLVSRIASAQPLNILPKKTVHPVPPESVEQSLLSNPFTSLSVDETDSAENSESATPFGPLTAEQAVNEAAADLEKTHRTVLSEIEHRIGMACMQLGKHKEAMTHFQKAVELDYAPAAFNLGLCYETGIGTLQDLKLAARYYDMASKLGHATAMYNLGVFHVRGWGGVQIDSNKARELFVAAAKLGQSNAKKALDMVSSHEERTDHIVQNEDIKMTEKPVAETRQENTVYKSSTIPDSVRSTQRKLDPTKAFYQLLGIRNTDTSEEGFNINNSVIHNKDITPLSIVC